MTMQHQKLTNPWIEAVREFHDACDQDDPTVPTLRDSEVTQLRFDLIEEELTELGDALDDGDIIEIADALGDLIYVVVGAALSFGIDLDPVIEEIHRSNMTKFIGGAAFREDGKLLKGDFYEQPDIRMVLANQKDDNPDGRY